jgi:signal transduction histidine kinase
LHFQVEPDGRVTSPQAPPAGDVRKIAQARYTTAEDVARAQEHLKRVADIVKSPGLLAALPEPLDAGTWGNNKLRVASNGGSVTNGNLTLNRDNTAQSKAEPPAYPNSSQQQQVLANARDGFNGYNNFINPPAQQLEQQAAVQQRRGQQEYAARQQTQAENNEILVNSTGNYLAPGVSLGVMTPLWAGDAADTLLLVRRVSVNGRSYVQGCLLDWPAVRQFLLAYTTELLQAADVVPVRNATDDKQPRMLASIPARLIMGSSPAAATLSDGQLFLAAIQNPSPTAVTLIVAWLGVLLAGAAVAILLRGVIALSQRRAGFVSAVTHELRTPLTTLRMYTEMLADGMVSDPERQASYHKTLRAEANRLGHLVDNVLLYSRLERSARDTRVEAAPLAGLLERLVPRLADRAAQAGMTVDVQVAADAVNARIRANLLSVEQILFNLVDNACKYAGSATERAIELRVGREADGVQIRVSDHGPGLDAAARARLFQPFSKSVHEAADTAPGLGLGLALSYRLAKNMNAELKLDSAEKGGATFVLTLPVE